MRNVEDREKLMVKWVERLLVPGALDGLQVAIEMTEAAAREALEDEDDMDIIQNHALLATTVGMRAALDEQVLNFELIRESAKGKGKE